MKNCFDFAPSYIHPPIRKAKRGKTKSGVNISLIQYSIEYFGNLRCLNTIFTLNQHRHNKVASIQWYYIYVYTCNVQILTGHEGNTWFIGPSDRNVAQSQNHVPKIPVNNCQFCYTLYYRCKYSFKQLFMLQSSASSALFRWRRTHMVWQLRSWTSRTIHIKFFRPRLNFNLFNWLFVRKTLYRSYNTVLTRM